MVIGKYLDGENMEVCNLQPINMSLSVVKELDAKWLAEMGEYMADNPHL